MFSISFFRSYILDSGFSVGPYIFLETFFSNTWYLDSVTFRRWPSLASVHDDRA